MRAAILCGSLEPGRDGVGDYSRRLAEECRRQGATINLIALNDHYVFEAATIGEPGVETLRLPASLPWRERSRLAAAALDGWGSERVSLQLVSYAYQVRGILWSFPAHLRSMLGSRALHIMFHELWVGAALGEPWKARLLGVVQRNAIERLARLCSPAAIATSNESYRSLLRSRGINSSLLPLFGNIEIAAEVDNCWVSTVWERLALSEADRRETLLGVMFGTIHPEWEPEPLLSSLREQAARAGKRLVLVAAGRLGAGERRWDLWAREYGPDLPMLQLGEQPASRISSLLQRADFGIAASPWQLAGKSGTIASMQEHGLPVIVNRHDIRLPGVLDAEPTPLLLRADGEAPVEIDQLTRTSPSSRLPEVGSDFLAQLAGMSRGHATA